LPKMVSAFFWCRKGEGEWGGEPTTKTKTTTVANSELASPSYRPTATASAVTVAECEDGIPPEPTSCFASHRFSLYQVVRTLMDCAMAKVSTAATSGQLENTAR